MKVVIGAIIEKKNAHSLSCMNRKGTACWRQGAKSNCGGLLECWNVVCWKVCWNACDNVLFNLLPDCCFSLLSELATDDRSHQIAG